MVGKKKTSTAIFERSLSQKTVVGAQPVLISVPRLPISPFAIL
jgi:hypothetical protein